MSFHAQANWFIKKINDLTFHHVIKCVRKQTKVAQNLLKIKTLLTFKLFIDNFYFIILLFYSPYANIINIRTISSIFKRIILYNRNISWNIWWFRKPFPIKNKSKLHINITIHNTAIQVNKSYQQVLRSSYLAESMDYFINTHPFVSKLCNRINWISKSVKWPIKFI